MKNAIILFFVVLAANAKSQTLSKEIQLGNDRLIYSCSYINGIFESNFKFLTNQTIKYETNYSLDTSTANFKVLQHKQVATQAQNLSFPLAQVDYIDISNKVTQLIDSIFAIDNFDKKLVQSVFFHKAILKAKERSFVTGTYECLPHPGFFYNKTYFFDQRDYFLNKDILKKIVNSSPQQFTDSSSILFANFINNTTDVNVSFEKLYSFYVDKVKFLTSIENILQYSSQNNTNNSAPNCAWYCLLCGSSWGCCGNYSGCCFYANTLCYLHDRACAMSGCQPAWFCFPGCVVE